MTTNDPFDRQIVTWLDTSAGAAAPDYLDETIAAINNLHQRSSWMFPGRWLPVQLDTRLRIPVPALIAVLLVTLLIGLGVVGGRLRLPGPPPLEPAPPYGLAKAGLIAFARDGQIVLASPDGSTRLLHPSEETQFGATFSRDGTRVAFWQYDGTKLVDGISSEQASDLWVVDADGSHAVNLTPDLLVAPWLGNTGSWSPDGSSIAFTADKYAPMHVVRTDGSAPPRAIGDGLVMPFNPAWSPDGTRIAFAGPERLADEMLGPSRVYVINPDGTGQERVSREDVRGEAGLPQWSPDGRKLLYTFDEAARGAPGATPVWPSTQVNIVAAERGATGWTERVVVPPSATWLSAFSNEGSRIAFLRLRPGILGGDLFVVGVDGSGERIVSDRLVSLSMPCWSPDDQAIAMQTGPIPPGVESVGLGWPNQAYTLFPVAGGSPSEIPVGRVVGAIACAWQRLAP